MSAKACVTHQATWPLWPKCGKPGTPGTVNPSASKASQAMCVCAYMLGSSNWRCGSPASSGRPAAVREGASAQLLLPPPVESTEPQRRHGLDRRRHILQRRDPTLRLDAGRDTQQLASAIVVAQLGNLFGANSAQRSGAPQLEPHRAHQEPTLTHRGDRVVRPPGLRRLVEQLVFDREHATRDEGVHTCGIGLEHAARLGRQRRRGHACAAALAVELARQPVGGDARRTDPLRPSA